METKNKHETWLKFQAYHTYEVSSKGQVRSVDKYIENRLGNLIRRQFIPGELLNGSDSCGYRAIRVRADRSGKTKKFYIHRLVAQLFIPNPENKPHINHKNGIRSDNRVENLEWCTHQENIQHAHDTGLAKAAIGSRANGAKLNELFVTVIKEAIILGHPTPKIARYFNVGVGCIEGIKRNKYWKHVNIDYEKAA